jgi:hypothetical protein
LQRGTYVEVRWPSLAAFGEVRYCVPVSEREFDVGLQIEQIVQAPAVESEHLTDARLSLFLVGAMAAKDMTAASAHIERCPLCKRELAAVEDRLLSDGPPRSCTD